MNKIKEYFSNIGYASKIIYMASKKYFILKLFLSILSSVLPYLPLFLWRELINNLTEAIKGNPEPFVKNIWAFACGYAAVILAEKLLDTISDFVSYKYNDAIQYYMDNLMIDKVVSIDLAFFDSSDLKDKLNNSWSLIYSMKSMVSFVSDMFQKAIHLVISFSLMLNLSFWLIPIVVLLCIPSIIGDKEINEMDYRFQKEHEKDHRELEYYKSLFFEETRQEVRLYHLTGYFSSLYTNLWIYYDKAVNAKKLKTCLIHSVSLLILTVNEVMVYILSVSKLIAGQIAVGDVAYYVSLMTQFRANFTSLCYRINMFGKNSKEISDVRSFLEIVPHLEKSGTLTPGKHPQIEFRDVSFHYPNSDRDVLSHCSFIIHQSEKIGLVGLNGSGKSTIVKLLCRFYDPTDGQILIDGIDNKEYDIVKLRKLFGVLFQDYVRYSFSLRENIALSDISCINCDDRIIKAAEKSRVSDFIDAWEGGIDENLTRRFDPNGKELSGGQWQRVSLARAFFRNASIVLLDEPSAALDPIAEHNIFEEFSAASEGRSAVLISHRLSSITLCDRILVLQDGRIVENGSHSELLSQNGEYARLFYLQASKYI